MLLYWEWCVIVVDGCRNWFQVCILGEVFDPFDVE